MKDKYPDLPSQRDFNKGRNDAYALAVERLKALANVKQQCLNSGATLEITTNHSFITLNYFGKAYVIILPEANILLKDSIEEASLTDKILILHYFLNAKERLSDKEQLSFRDLSEGRAYYPTFYKRTISPLLRHFGNDFNRLESLIIKLNSHKSNIGDLSYNIIAFDYITVTLVLWKGDDDFDSEANYLFRSNIKDYLPIEDIAYLCQLITVKLITASS
jgi:hypothetical protein